MASHYRRAQETATAIGEVLGLPVETDDDLHEVRQSDAFYAAAPDFGDTGSITWMPRNPRAFAEAGAESFDAVAGRVLRVQDRLAARAERERALAVSHWGFLHFFLGATLFGAAFEPAHLAPLYRVSHANTGISIFERRAAWAMDGADFDGWALRTWNDQGHLAA